MITKVLILSENSIYDKGGIERHCRSIKSMFEKDVKVEIKCLSKDDIGYRIIKGIKKVVLNKSNLIRAIKDSSCDIVHIHGFASYSVYQYLRIAKKLGKKVIYTAHFHPFNTLERPLLGRLFFKLFLQGCLKWVNTIVVINNEDKAFFGKYNSNVVRIPNWITNIELVECSKESNMILAVGRNDSNKGFFHLNSIPMDKYNVHLVADNKNGLDERIILHQNISDVELSKLYTQASLLVVPSRYEAFSYVALEALERGTPVLLSDRVRIYDYLIGQSGVNVFCYGNLNDFVSKIETTAIQSVDRDFVRETFSEGKIKNKLHTIYTI